MASSQSLLDMRTAVTARTAAVALMNAPEAPVCRRRGWKANLNQSVSKACVMHLVPWYLGLWMPLSGDPRAPCFQSGEQSASPKFKNPSEHLRNFKLLFYSLDISWFLGLPKNSPEQGCFSDSVTTQT